MAVQGHPRPLISVPIVIVMSWSYLAPFQRYYRFCAKTATFPYPTPIPPEIRGHSPWTRSPMLRVQSAESRLILHVSPNVRDHKSSTSRTDRRTDSVTNQRSTRDYYNVISTNTTYVLLTYCLAANSSGSEAKKTTTGKLKHEQPAC